MWKRIFIALVGLVLQWTANPLGAWAGEQDLGCTPDSVLFGTNPRPWYPGEPIQWADQRLLDSLIATKPDRLDYQVESPRSKGYTKSLQYFRSPEGKSALFVQGDLRYIRDENGANASSSIVVGHNYWSHSFWYQGQLHFQNGQANWFKHAQRLYHSQETGEIEFRVCAEAPEGAENAVVFNNDTASFFIMMTGHLEDANEHPEVYCLPHRSSHWLHLGQLHNGMSRIKGRSHGKSLKDYILISGEGTYIVLRKSDLQWTELPSPLAQFRAKHHRIQTGKSPNSWFVYRGNTAEYSGTEGRCKEDFSELVKGAVWSPLVIPPTPTPFIVRVLNNREAWIVLVVLAVCAALIVQVQRKAKSQALEIQGDFSQSLGEPSPLFLSLMKHSKKDFSSEELDVMIGLSNVQSPETRRSRRARIIQLINTESEARFGKVLLLRKKSESDKRVVIYRVQDLSNEA